jgi:hypothetical protein
MLPSEACIPGAWHRERVGDTSRPSKVLTELADEESVAQGLRQ